MAVVVDAEAGAGETYDEEGEERDQYEIEQLILEFNDEPSVRHDQIPESDGEEEKGLKKKPTEVIHIKRGDGRLYKNQTFLNGVAFKDSVLDYALRTGRNIQQYRYDKDKIGFKCVGSNEGEGCEWKVYASVLPNDNVWKVRVFVEKHSCVPNGECSMLRVPQIARLFVDKIREEPEYYMPMKIEEMVQEKWGITVSRPQCQAARNKALKWIEFEYDHQFARLRDYAAELIESNKDSTVVIDTLKNDKGEDEFNRLLCCHVTQLLLWCLVSWLLWFQLIYPCVLKLFCRPSCVFCSNSYLPCLYNIIFCSNQSCPTCVCLCYLCLFLMNMKTKHNNH